MNIVYISSIVVATIFISIAVFQVLLVLGYPLGEFALGGYYRILPKGLRIVSAMNVLILLFMGFIFLQHTNVIIGFKSIPTTLFVWIITIYLGLNMIVNLLSKSKKERFVMTPLSCIAFLICLFIALS